MFRIILSVFFDLCSLVDNITVDQKRLLQHIFTQTTSKKRLFSIPGYIAWIAIDFKFDMVAYQQMQGICRVIKEFYKIYVFQNLIFLKLEIRNFVFISNMLERNGIGQVTLKR